MVQITQKEHDKHKRESIAQAKSRLLIEVGDRISQALTGLTSVLTKKTEDSKLVGAINKLTTEVKKSNGNTSKEGPATIINEFPKALGEKIDKLSEAISKKPESFEFDIKRNYDGNIDKVLVKPIRK